mmetsp:Transcript_45637/g.117956  ORF Transcript_45637/g.117956 Transcript_45637/m.117956 type:complete len:134 (+) Transcript_45637:393-794(+)
MKLRFLDQFGNSVEGSTEEWTTIRDAKDAILKELQTKGVPLPLESHEAIYIVYSGRRLQDEEEITSESTHTSFLSSFLAPLSLFMPFLTDTIYVRRHCAHSRSGGIYTASVYSASVSDRTRESTESICFPITC